VEIAEGGIHHRDVGAAREHEPPGGFILGGSVKPQAIENNVVDHPSRLPKVPDVQIGHLSGGAIDHIVFDRLWLHGTAQDETTRGLMLTGSTYVAVVDSSFSDFHCVAVTGTCSDSQAIGGGIGDRAMGPYKIVNNYLEAAGENIIFWRWRGDSHT